ncbi:phospholipase D-like domain-containing protein [Mariniflexile sp.]|uniref:phospholipase D-like domain-containing protein n=1 Tax=Mariniflexile sp. TaxID=1979402 RepID=UPI0040486088
MIVENNIKSNIQSELFQAKSVWIATAMISKNGWDFIQKNISKNTQQHFLIGIDLSTEPKVFEILLDNLHINARVYKTNFTFHPKVYLIQKNDNTYTAFIGSSNTTNWGLEKNVEMNFQVNDQNECLKLLNWFDKLYDKGYIITEDFIKDFKSKFIKAKYRSKETQIDISSITNEISRDEGQFFSRNHHKIFEEKYHRIENNELKKLRKEVSDKLKELHKSIYSKFDDYGLSDLHPHHNKSDIVSRYYFNKFSGYIVNAMWLHYGKSHKQLQQYKNLDKSINKPYSFINNIRIQVIIHENSIGIWLVLGKNGGSLNDRKYFREQMKYIDVQKNFFKAYKELGDKYWISLPNIPSPKEIKTPDELYMQMKKENINEYFIIGCNINWLDNRLSNDNISNTILSEFKKLYPLYKLMKHN